MQGIIKNDWSTVKRDVLQSTSHRRSIGCQEAYLGGVMGDFHPIKLLSLHRPVITVSEIKRRIIPIRIIAGIPVVGRIVIISILHVAITFCGRLV